MKVLLLGQYLKEGKVLKNEHLIKITFVEHRSLDSAALVAIDAKGSGFDDLKFS